MTNSMIAMLIKGNYPPETADFPRDPRRAPPPPLPSCADPPKRAHFRGIRTRVYSSLIKYFNITSIIILAVFAVLGVVAIFVKKLRAKALLSAFCVAALAAERHYDTHYWCQYIVCRYGLLGEGCPPQKNV